MERNITNPTSTTYDTYKSRGHIRSASLENANSFILKNTLGLPLITPGHTGTLKSRNEQKRLKNRFGSHNNLDDYVAQSKSKFQNLRNMFEAKNDLEQQQQSSQPLQLQSPLKSLQLNQNNYHNHNNQILDNHSHQQQQQQMPQQTQFSTSIQSQNYQQHQQHQQLHQRIPNKLMNGSLNIHQNQSTLLHHNGHIQQRPQQQQPQQLQQQSFQPKHSIQLIEFNENLNIIEDQINGLSINGGGITTNHHHHSKIVQQQPHQSGSSCSENGVDQAKNLLKPIAFKPIPFEPDYSIPNRYSDLCDRYGSTPSLAPIQGPNMKFGSTTDLRHGGYNSYCSNLMARRRCSRSLKINDSMESVRHTPDSDANSQSSTIKSSNKFHHHQDQFDMTPSPSDSGISELEAALKDRDSELSYLRQTMEHNEKVIFKVHKDKEAYWEQETKRLKAFYESQQREYLMKIKKLEQMLTLQSFQFKQNKLRLSENSNRIKEQFTDLKNENDLLRNETQVLKTTEKTMRDHVLQLEEKINVMNKLILNLKTQLEENEWTVCQKNGEIALLKTQLKEAKMEITLKDHEMVIIKTEHQEEIQNHNENLVNVNNNTEFKNNNNIEISQLNRIIILKDQVILALTNELGKLRKELSDLEIFHEYGEEPSGKYTRLKYKIENLTGICNQNKTPASNDINSENSENQSNSDDINNKITTATTVEKFVRKALEEDDLDVIINCLKSTGALSDSTFNIDDTLINTLNINGNSDGNCHGGIDNIKKPNLPDVTRNFLNKNQDQIKNSINHNQIYDETESLKRELYDAKTAFETEKQEWAEEKDKVLAYQRQLQMHYINMYQKMKELENQLSKKC